MTEKTTETPAATATPSTDAGGAPASSGQEPTVKDIMEFDPFGPAKTAEAEATADGTGTKDEGAKPGTEAKPGEETQQTQQPKPAEATQTQPTPTAPTQKEAELQAQIDALQQVIKQQPAPATQEKPGEKKPEAPRYNLGVPKELIAAIRSEDENEVGIAVHAIVNGVANRVWNDVTEHFTKELLPAIQQQALQAVTQHQEMQRVRTEFYGEHPHLDNPMLHPLVQQAGAALARDWASKGKAVVWSKEFRDGVAELVHKVIPKPAPVQTQQAQPKPKSFQSQPGSRPAAGPTNEFADVL